MSHKKRASTALKSMGAAGLVAATIVSGLSFGAASATAAPTTPSITANGERVLGSFVLKNSAGVYYAVTSVNGPGSPTGAKVSATSSLATAKSRAVRAEFPAPGTTGPIKSGPNGSCLTIVGSRYAAWGSCGNASQFRMNENLGLGAFAFSTGTSSGYHLGFSGGATLATYDEIVAAINKPLVANLTSTSNINKSAVISGTATPNQTVTIGSKTVNVNADGKWTMTVTGLANGVNSLVAVQKRGTTEIDRKNVAVTIVEGGGLFAVDQGPVELERGETTQVPFVVENRVSRTNTKGTVVLTAPDGATFSEQDTVQGSWRRVGNTAWNASTSIPLSNGRLSNDNTTLTFDVDWASERPTDQQYRFMIDVTAAADAPEAPSAMEFDFSGTSSTNDFRAQGSTSTTVGTSVVDLTAEVSSVDNEARSAVVTGTATPGADISIGDETAKADATTGAWSITVGDLEVGDNALVVIQKINDREIDRKTVTATVEGRTELAPITLSGPASVTPGRSNTFNGTAEPGATFRVLNVSGTQIVPGTFEVGADGRWSFDRVVSNGASNFRFVIEQTKNGHTEKSELFTINASALAPVTVTTPAAVRPGLTNTFTGTAEPGATFRVLNVSGTQIVPGTFEVDAQGNWSFNRVVSNGASNFRFVIEQTKNGQTEKSELFTINAAALAPVTVTTPERVTPGRSNTFTGTGEPGATFRVLNISGTQIVPGTHEVDAQGNWTFDRVVSNGASNFRFVIEQSKNGQTEKSELFTINAADFAQVTVANRSVTPGAVNTFTGTGEPGASYRVLNITGTQIVPGTFEVDAQGNWTFDRAVSRGATEFRFALEQTKNGKTELSELFTLPADTK
ncbi:hypothetical protein [Curtobacterium flaccumfaciens]|uniref:hypothetical protein n=1 Tax=Curtobacterium flaccumfaciens TaxID=2035 RepID=UPI00344047E8